MPPAVMPAPHPLDTLDNVISLSADLVPSPSSSSASPSLFSSSSPTSSSSSSFTTFTSSDSLSSSLPSPASPSLDSRVSSPSLLSRLVRRVPPHSCWSGPPPFCHRRTNLRVYTNRPFLLCLFSLQLALHTVYLAASILLLTLPSLLTDLLEGGDKPSAFVCLEYVPTFLVVRSMISIPLSVRRLWLMRRWQSTWVDSAVCVVLLAATCVMSAVGLIAVAQLPSSSAWMYPVSWLLVGSLLLLAGWQLAMYAVLLLFFRMEALTISTPMLPLDQHYYEHTQHDTSQPKKNEGLTPQQLQSMPTSLYDGGRDDAVCAVCMDDVEVGQVERVLRCGHAYHQPCIDQWLLKKRVCPLCVRAVRPSQSRSSVGEWVVEMVDRVKVSRSEESQVEPLAV